jgi:hypothetical protein
MVIPREHLTLNFLLRNVVDRKVDRSSAIGDEGVDSAEPGLNLEAASERWRQPLNVYFYMY